jgi:hypothetical protein
MAAQYLEEMIYKLLVRSLTDNEKKHLHSWYDLTNHVDEESREDMKDALFDFVLNNINYYRVIEMLKEHITEEEGEEEEDDAGW